MDYNELGGGFKLAMNDLQIRGGGNILGESQSGNIAAVGYDLYLELLQSTVGELKKKAEGRESEGGPEIDPEIKFRFTGFLPESYIEDPAQRFHLYRRISTAGSTSAGDLAELESELVDRFGIMPPEAATLFAVIGLKPRLRNLGITRLEQAADCLVFSFIKEPPLDPQIILDLISRKPGKGEKPLRLTPDNRLVVPLKAADDPYNTAAAIVRHLEE